jgi:DNA polymerase-4
VSRRQLERDGPGRDLGDDDTGCTVLHVDMDAFYASCELRTRPDLVGRPVVVGVAAARSVVLAASYEARRFGVHSALPMSQALRRCPQAVVLAPTPGLYAEVSGAVMAVFADVTPVVEPLSLDEAFLDVAGSVRRLGPPTQIAASIRARVHAEQGITCSVGVASTKHVAKLASTRCKPDGLLVVPRDRVLDFLHPLPVAALWGVGDKTEATLHRLGLVTVGDLAQAPVEVLRHGLGRAVGEQLHDLAWGRDGRAVESSRQEKSIGAEETFGEDVEDADVIRAELLRLADRVAARSRDQQLVGRTVVLKLRFADFTTITRSRTLAAHTDVGREIYRTAAGLFDALGLDRVRVRLVGVRVESLVAASAVPQQLALDEPEPAWRDAEEVADRAAGRYGAGALRPARLVGRPRPGSGADPAPDR